MVKHFHQVKRLEEDLLAFMPSAIPGTHGVLAVGINGDSLATWFLNAIGEFLKREKVVLDLRSDDQEQTHRLLKEGEVMGCISARDRPVQGCRMDYLGRMTYRMLASPSFVSRWFPDGAGPAAAGRAPIVVFNRVDELHHHFFRELYRQPLDRFNAHYLPSSEQFVDFIAAGHAYGMLPDLQSGPLTASGRLVEIVPGRTVSVDLYWHCWNLRSGLTERFSAHLIAAANRLLEN
jgi:LysR family transcriptional regulator (chromosome initiation inhibitor)